MLNKIIIMGRLVRDPELRRTQSGTAVTSFRLAVDRDYKAEDGSKQADFFDVVAWRSTAEFVSKYFLRAAWPLWMAGSRAAPGRTRTATSGLPLRSWPIAYISATVSGPNRTPPENLLPDGIRSRRSFRTRRREICRFDGDR